MSKSREANFGSKNPPNELPEGIVQQLTFYSKAHQHYSIVSTKQQMIKYTHSLSHHHHHYHWWVLFCQKKEKCSQVCFQLSIWNLDCVEFRLGKWNLQNTNADNYVETVDHNLWLMCLGGWHCAIISLLCSPCQKKERNASQKKVKRKTLWHICHYHF